MSKSATHGGPRPGAGRPRVTIFFSVDQSTMDQARRLCSAGFPLGEHIESLVHEKHSLYFNEYNYDTLALIDSLQLEQPEVELEKEVEFYCINKKVKMTIQELINYYIDTECAEVADECGF